MGKDMDIKEQIIESARKIFSRYGFRKTTIDEIANAIHKGKSSIYHYFGSKEEIFKGVIKKEYEYLKKKVDEALRNQESPKEKLRAYVLTRLKVLSQLSNFYAALKNDYFECLGLIEAIRIRYVEEEIDTFENILKEGVDRGIFNVKNIKVTAHAIIIALKGLEYAWAMEEDQQELEKNVNNMLDMFFYGIVKQ
ncbi:MAG: TetR/AcrR family transcriptional regulator [Spirochaetales bacterium]|nr:TetR/AcrR family transcriptional regulator [Spirochaetales bacterium]